MRWDGKLGDNSEGQIITNDNQMEGFEVYGVNHGPNEELSTTTGQGKFLWEFSTYSLIWPTYTPIGEQAYVQNELLRINS